MSCKQQWKNGHFLHSSYFHFQGTDSVRRVSADEPGRGHSFLSESV